MNQYSDSSNMRNMLDALKKLAESENGTVRTAALLEYKREVTARSFGNKLSDALLKHPTHSIPDGLQGAQTLIQMAQNPNRFPDKAISMDIGGASVSMSPATAKEVLAQQQPRIADLVLSYIEQGDPTKTKIYTPWMAREFANGNIRQLEDIPSRLTPLLTDYETYKRKKDFPQEGKDIMRLTAQNFEKIISGYTPPEEVKQDRGEYETVFDDSSVRVIVPNDETSACYYGQGTTWCTAATRGSNMFGYYNNQGKLYILLPKNPNYDGEKYQLHFQSSQFMDEQDSPIDLVELLTERFPELKEFFMNREPELRDMVVFAPDSVLQPVIEKIGEIIQDAAWDIVSEWEASDDYYRNWQSEQARERGYLLKDDGEPYDHDKDFDSLPGDDDDEKYEYLDQMDIDWDRVYDDKELNDYTDFNDEARYFIRNAKDIAKLSPSEVREYAEFRSNDAGEPVLVSELDNVYSYIIQDHMNDSGWKLRELVDRRLIVRKDGDEYTVRLTSK